MGAFLFRRFCPCGQCHHQKVCKHNRIAAPVKAARQQITLSRTLRNLPEVASGTYTSTHRNPPDPEPASGTYTSTRRNLPEPSGTFRNLPEPSGTCLGQHTPEPSGTFRNLPPEPTPAHAGTFRNLHQHTSEPFRIFRNLPPEPTPAHTGTLRNLPEPNPPEPFSSGTCSWDPHRRTPELIWAEDPMSLRCWGKKTHWLQTNNHFAWQKCVQYPCGPSNLPTTEPPPNNTSGAIWAHRAIRKVKQKAVSPTETSWQMWLEHVRSWTFWQMPQSSTEIQSNPLNAQNHPKPVTLLYTTPISNCLMSLKACAENVLHKSTEHDVYHVYHLFIQQFQQFESGDYHESKLSISACAKIRAPWIAQGEGLCFCFSTGGFCSMRCAVYGDEMNGLGFLTAWAEPERRFGYIMS